jgi:hypothetical protein
MKKIPLLAAVLVLGASLPGCGASIIKKPEVLSVKKMAIVSVVMNTDTYNIEQAKQKSGLDVRALKKMVGMEEDIDTDLYLQLVTSGLDSYHKELGSMSQWQAKPFFVSPPGMHQIHYADVAKTGTTTYVDGKEVHEEARKKLGQLAKDLGVDGVVIIEIDFGYEPVFLSGMKGTGLLSGIRAPAKPSVSSSMVIITKDGAIAAQSPAVVKGGGTRYAGDKVNMIHQGKVDLKDKDGASVKEAARTIGYSAAGLKAKLLKEFESN